MNSLATEAIATSWSLPSGKHLAGRPVEHGNRDRGAAWWPRHRWRW